MVAHHQSSMVGRACASGEITRAGPAQRQTAIAEGVDHPQGSSGIPYVGKAASAIAHHHRNAHRALVFQKAALVEHIIVVSIMLSLRHGVSLGFIVASTSRR